MKWISIDERLPEIDENVILYDGTEVFCGTHHKNNMKESYFGNQCCDGVCYGWYEKDPITHWMPLPEVPKDGE